MNGLKYIRTRCNLSLNELADILGVSRQALSMWETEKKDIPQKRQEQLSQFFGIDAKFFGSITEQEKQELLEKAMFRYEVNGKETYRFSPNKDTDKPYVEVCFLEDRETSFDEMYVQAQKKRKDTLEAVEDIINWTDNAGSIQSQICCINRGCQVYDLITDMMQKMREQPSNVKMHFFFEMVAIWNAMAVAYGIKDEEELIANIYKYKSEEMENPEWIRELAKIFKDHWTERYDAEMERHSKVLQDLKAKRQEKEKTNTNTEKNLSLEERVAQVEKEYKKERRNNPETKEIVYVLKK